MYYDFYLDVYFLENLIMNCLTLYMGGLVQKSTPSRVRIFAAGALGAILACAIVVSPIHKNVLLSLACSLAGCPLMAAAGYGRRRLRERTLTVMGASFALGGIWQLLEGALNMPFCLAVPAGYLLARGAWRLRRAAKSRTQYIYEVVLNRGEKSVCLRGLLDSGNRLVQPVTARPVHILDLAEAEKLLSGEELRELAGFLDFQPGQEASGKFSYIPYHTIGNQEGMLPAMTLDSICIKHGESAQSTKRVLVAISREAVSSGGEYQMILHPRILD